MNIEEKARKYAGNLIPTESLYFDAEKISLNIENTFIESKYDAFISGYTQAITDISADNAQLREALRELVENVEKLNLNLFGTDYTVYVNNIKDNLARAKTLIE